MSDLTAVGVELAVAVTGLALLLLELVVPPAQKRQLGYVAAGTLLLVFLGSFAFVLPEPRAAFGGMIVLDEFGLFFKRLFLLAGALVLLMAADSPQDDGVAVEYYALVLMALTGMLLAASAHDFSVLFVSLELIAVSFYVLIAFRKRRLASLEAGAKYLVLGALASAFLVYGIALAFGAGGTLDFGKLAAFSRAEPANPLLAAGLLFILAGLGFKLAMVPFQVWAPDVYQGAPTPTTAFLAVGSKAAGVVLLLRVLHAAVPGVLERWGGLLAALAALTILWGNLGAIPQRNVKRLLGYSSIAHAGYLLLAVATLSWAGVSAVLYYLAGYLFTTLGAFIALGLALEQPDADDLEALAGLHRRSPLLAATLTLALASLAGVPPLAGFFGKFLVFKAAIARADAIPGVAWLLAAALAGVAISLYYYFKVIRAIFWSAESGDLSPVPLPPPMRWTLWGCIAGMLVLGVFPAPVYNLAEHAARALIR